MVVLWERAEYSVVILSAGAVLTLLEKTLKEQPNGHYDPSDRFELHGKIRL